MQSLCSFYDWTISFLSTPTNSAPKKAQRIEVLLWGQIEISFIIPSKRFQALLPSFRLDIEQEGGMLGVRKHP